MAAIAFKGQANVWPFSVKRLSDPGAPDGLYGFKSPRPQPPKFDRTIY